MKEEMFEKLVMSLEESREIRHGRRKASRISEISAPNIKMVRRKLKVSQAEFAMMVGVSARTLQNWEQGRRQPVGPAKALLRVAVMNPEAVLQALHGKQQ
ncbi:MAG TPA: NadS family protein [bacterium]|nr:NadS family protein [bacterium]